MTCDLRFVLAGCKNTLAESLYYKVEVLAVVSRLNTNKGDIVHKNNNFSVVIGV